MASLPTTFQCISAANARIPPSKNLVHLQATTLLTKYVYHDIEGIKIHMDMVYKTVHENLETATVRNMKILTTLASTQASLNIRLSSLEVKVGLIDEKMDVILDLL